jgi:hypothetical protein
MEYWIALELSAVWKNQIEHFTPVLRLKCARGGVRWKISTPLIGYLEILVFSTKSSDFCLQPITA